MYIYIISRVRKYKYLMHKNIPKNLALVTPNCFLWFPDQMSLFGTLSVNLSICKSLTD